MNTEKQFTDAFNNGYILAAHEPKLMRSISQNLAPTNNYLEGFLAGKNQLEFENYKDQLNELQNLRDQINEKSKSVDKDY